VLVFHDIDQMSIDEIARILEIPAGTVSTRLRLARGDFEAALRRHQARERHAGRAVLLPLFGARALLEAERRLPPMPEGVEERAWQRLRGATPSVAAPAVRGPLGALGAGPALGGAFLLGLALGAVWEPLHRSKAAVSRETPNDPPSYASVRVVPTSAPSASSSPSPLSTTAESGPPEIPLDASIERALLDKAGGLLASGKAGAAIAALEEHARRFRGGGRLAEEREMRWIEALLQLGRAADASARLDRFARRYPNNPRIQGLQKAVSGDP